MRYYFKTLGKEQWHDLVDVTQGNFDNPRDEEPDGYVIGTLDLDAHTIFVDEDRLYLFVVRQDVESSNIKSVGHSGARNVLVVEFLNGSIYLYKNVPVEVYTDMLEATSKGRYFNKHVKGTFECTKVEDAQ